jgi:amidophosphoribosyltransferase
MCGIIGIVGTSPVAQSLYDGLTVLQHRGQDAAGIATMDGGRINLHKDSGLVRDVFDDEKMQHLAGTAGIGHVRYPTAGCDGIEEAQPLYVNSPYGIVLAHNGNLVNADALKEEIFQEDRRHINTESDSEVILNILAHELQNQAHPIGPGNVFKAIETVHKRSVGGYAVVAMIAGQGLVAFRDPNGIRPCVFGQRRTDEGLEYIVASESVALDILGFELIDDIHPGEGIFVTLDGQLHRRQCAEKVRHAPCIFEFVYFARPDSMIDDISVYKARLRMGERLAEKILNEWPEHDIDVVIPIPDTSRTSALPLAFKLGVKYREGFIKNRYIGRTFIMPEQGQRTKSVRRKLNPISLEFRGKNVLLIDDSIVRGTTSRQIIQMAREAGARKVYLASAAPPVRYPNVYGIDMPAASELIAHGRSAEDIRQQLGADWLIYQDLDDLVAACSEGNDDISEFDTSCFSSEYITGLADGYLEKLENLRSDSARRARRVSVA